MENHRAGRFTITGAQRGSVPARLHGLAWTTGIMSTPIIDFSHLLTAERAVRVAFAAIARPHPTAVRWTTSVAYRSLATQKGATPDR